MSSFPHDLRALHSRGLHRYSLAIILAAAFALMTLVSVQQQRVIGAQQELIHSLARDSFAYLQVIARGRHARPPKGSGPVSK